MKSLKITIVFLVLTAFISMSFAGTVKEFKGKAELLIGGKWTQAAAGMNVPDGTRIMTGVGGSVTITTKVGYFLVKEMSMVSYAEKTADKQVDQKVVLNVGKVKIRYDKVEDIKSTFKVETPQGTASVRGTEEEVSYFPASGLTLLVIEGSVVLEDNNGNSFINYQGENSGINTGGDLYSQTDLNQDDLGLNGLGNNDDINAIDDQINNPADVSIQEPERL